MNGQGNQAAQAAGMTPEQQRLLDRLVDRLAELQRQSTDERFRLDEAAAQAYRTRAEGRYRFTVIAVGIVGVAGPILLQTTASGLVDLPSLKKASIWLLASVPISVLVDLVDRQIARKVREKMFKDIAGGLLERSAEIQLTTALAAGMAQRPEWLTAGEIADKLHKEYLATAKSGGQQRFVAEAVFYGCFCWGMVRLLQAFWE